MKINKNTLRYDENRVTWKDNNEKEYSYEISNVGGVILKGEKEICIRRDVESGDEYLVIFPDGTEYLSYLWRSKEAYLIKDAQKICFENEIKGHIVDNNGNIYFVSGREIFFYQVKKKILEQICEIPEKYYFQRIEDLDNKYLSIICTPNTGEKSGFRDCRLGMELSSKKLVELGIAY